MTKSNRYIRLFPILLLVLNLFIYFSIYDCYNEINSITMKGESPLNKKVDSNSFNLNNAIYGQTNLRFWCPPPYTTDLLDIDDPGTYRPGIGYLTKYLETLSVCGQNKYWDNWPENLDMVFINNTVDKMITIFSTERLENAGLMSASWGLSTLKALGLLDKVNKTGMISHIKNHQLPDGGFGSSNYSTMKNTLYAVLALNAVAEEPKNTSAVKEFIDSLQVGAYDPESLSYEFLPYDWKTNNLSAAAPTIIETNRAGTILKILGYQYNNSDILFTKHEAVVNDILANYSTWTIDKQVMALYNHVKRSYYFPTRGAEIRESLKPIAWNLHQTLPDDSKWLHISSSGDPYVLQFAKTLVFLSWANPRVKCYVYPNSFYVNNTQQQFILRLNNTGPLHYSFTTKELAIENAYESILTHSGFTENVYQIEPDSIVDIPFTIEKKPGVNLANYLTQLFKLKLTFNVPVLSNLEYYADFCNYNGSVDFNVMFTEKPSNPTNNAVFSTLSLLALPAIIGLIDKRRKRKK